MVLSFVLPGRTRYDVFRQLTLQASPQPTPNEYTLHLQRRSQSPSTPPSVTRVRAQGKNVEILHAVEDLIKIIRAHPLYDHLESVSEDGVIARDLIHLEEDVVVGKEVSLTCVRRAV